MFWLTFLAITVAMIVDGQSFQFYYDFLHPFTFSSDSKGILSVSKTDNSNFYVLFSNGNIASYSSNFDLNWNKSLFSSATVPNHINSSITISPSYPPTILSPCPAFLVWNSSTNYIASYFANGSSFMNVTEVYQIIDVGLFSVNIANYGTLFIHTIFQGNKILGLKKHNTNPITNTTIRNFGSQGALNHSQLSSFSSAVFASQITLTQTWICSFDSGFVQKLIITAILNIQLNTLSFTSSSAYLSFHFMTQKIIKTENYIILQDTANTLTISQGAVLLNYTYDSAFSADSATSAFSYQQGNYINYPKKALLFETNDSNFVVSDSLSFQNSRNLTTIILPQNSFAYEYNKTFLYFLRNSLSSVSPTFNCSMDHCQYCSIQSNLCDNCDIGYSKNENNSCTLNVCNVLKQRNCLFCDFKGICIQCSDNLVLNLANLCVQEAICNDFQTLNTTSNTCQDKICSVTNCLSCNSSQNCLSCKEGWSLTDTFNCQKHSCNDTKCSLCQQSGPCQKCLPSYKLINNSCIRMDNSQYALSCEYFTDQYSKDICQQVITPPLQNAVIVSRIILSLPAIMYIASAIGPFVQFNHDYWYYLYHDRNTSNLIFTTIFQQVIMAMNSIRMIPFFIPADQIDNKIQDMINLVFPNNYTLYTNPKVLQIDQMQTKFVSNMEQIVVWNLMGNLIVSSFVTSSKWAFFVLLMAGGSRISTNQPKRKKSKKQKDQEIKGEQKMQDFSYIPTLRLKILAYLQKNKEISFSNQLIVLLIDSNGLFIAFNCALQFRSIFFFTPSDKINNFLCIFVIFICIMFTLCFYILMYAFNRRKAHHYLKYTVNRKSLYFIFGFYHFNRIFAFGFLQGLFLDNYLWLLIQLSTLKFINCCLIILNRKSYHSKLMFTLVFVYYLFGCLYDGFLLYTYEYYKSQSLIDGTFNDIETIVEVFLILGLIVVTLFMTLFKLFGTIKTLFKLFKPEGRKIQDDKKTVKKGGNGNILEMLEQGNQEDRILQGPLPIDDVMQVDQSPKCPNHSFEQNDGQTRGFEQLISRRRRPIRHRKINVSQNQLEKMVQDVEEPQNKDHKGKNNKIRKDKDRPSRRAKELKIEQQKIFSFKEEYYGQVADFGTLK